MRKAALVVGLAGLVAGCGTSENRWLTPIATAASAINGQVTTIATLTTPADGCEPLPAPDVQILQEGQLGVLMIQPGERLIDETGETCEGILQPTTVVLYEPMADQPGFDTVSFLEMRPGTRADREHTIEIRVR